MDDQDKKFECKWCNKRYPCGKSLGGHIKSHNIVDSSEKIGAHMKKVSSFIDEKSFKAESHQFELNGSSSSYGLRENPRKTFKAVDAIASFPLTQEKICTQCGKGFQSLKALCGHMACHSEKDKSLKDDHSWTSENQNLVLDSDSDTESEDQFLRSEAKMLPLSNGSSSDSEIDEHDQEDIAMSLMMLSKDSSDWGGVNSVVESSDNHSVILETKSSSIDMKLAKKDAPTSNFAPNEIPQTKKEYTHHLEAGVFEQENSDSGYYLDERDKAESHTSVDGFLNSNASVYENKRPNEKTLAEIKKSFNRLKNIEREHERSVLLSKLAKYEQRKKNNDSYEDNEVMNDTFRKVRHASRDDEQPKRAQKRSKYECMNCKKTFSTYQGLGGHRPCNKKINHSYEDWYETGENSLEDEDTDPDENNKRVKQYESKKKIMAKVEKKDKIHECPYCSRVFRNGQALGGHKRSHFLGSGAKETKNRVPVLKPEKPEPELLDLNLPAPLEDEVDEHFVSS